MTRRASLERTTKETSIAAAVDLDGGERSIVVPDGFFGHMLDAFTTHGGLGIELKATGDVHVDSHHTVEDTGIVLGEAIHEALGDRRGITRFAHAYVPLDEALVRAVVDCSGRGFFAWRCPRELEAAWVTRTFPLTLVADFFQSFADRGRLTLHLDVVEGRNPHHVAEAAFKAVAVALRRAVERRPGAAAVPSTKGRLEA